VVPVVNETTALGAAYLAGLATGFWKNRDELAEKWKARATYTPSMKAEIRSNLFTKWNRALQAAKAFR